jgi:ankyrin repeat protein
VRSLLKEKTDVNTSQPDGATALHWAAHRDDLETAELLIRAGAKVDAANDYGVTPIFLACTNGNAAMVERLLKAGANPNAALRTGQAALMTCARTGNVDAVKSLLAHGADVNAQEPQGQTALMVAVAQKNPEAARTLIEHGADIHARSKGGFTPLLFAARVGDLDSARILLAAGANVNEVTPDGMSVLLMASASGQEALSIYLLEKGADPNAADSSGLTALHYALLKGISNISAVQNVPVATYLFRPNMLELVKALLVHGANPNAPIVKQPPRPPLAVSPKITLVGATPFLLAAAAFDVEVMRVLVAGGADPLLTVEDKSTALMLAAGMGRFFDPPTEEDRRNALEAAKLAVELGIDVNAANEEGRTALHGAALFGADTIIQFLVDKGANVDTKDKLGMTPWSIAAGVISAYAKSSDKRNPIHQTTANLLRKLGAVPITLDEINRNRPTQAPPSGGYPSVVQ